MGLSDESDGKLEAQPSFMDFYGKCNKSGINLPNEARATTINVTLHLTFDCKGLQPFLTKMIKRNTFCD